MGKEMSKGKWQKAIVFMIAGIVILAVLPAGAGINKMPVRDSDAGYADTAFADICSLLAEHVERQFNKADVESYPDLGKKQKCMIKWESQDIEALVRQYLERPEGGIYLNEMEGIKKLHIDLHKIELYGENSFLIKGLFQQEPDSLNDLQYFTALTQLEVCRTDISDIGWIDNLTNLTYLDLHHNDISALSTLLKLTFLNLEDNQISDYTPVSFVPRCFY